MKEIQNRALKSTPRTNMTMSAVVRKHEGNSENDWCLASPHKLPKSLSLASCFSEKSRSATGRQAWPEIKIPRQPGSARASSAGTASRFSRKLRAQLRERYRSRISIQVQFREISRRSEGRRSRARGGIDAPALKRPNLHNGNVHSQVARKRALRNFAKVSRNYGPLEGGATTLEGRWTTFPYRNYGPP